MNDKHPIDELFSRGLGDAEAAPPTAVWEGIVRERNWAHLTLLRLRRQWGWLALVLLLGGTATYVGINSGREKQMADAQHPEQSMQPNALGENAPRSAPSLEVQQASFVDHDVEGTRTFASEVQGETHSSAAKPEHQSTKASVVKAEPVAISSARVSGSNESRVERPTPGTGSATIPDRPVRVVENEHVGPNDPEQELSASTSVVRSTEQPLSPAAVAMAAEPALRDDAFGLERIRPSMLQVRSSILDRELHAAEPQFGTPPEFHGPRHAWWVAITAGQFRETRTWHGGDSQLVNALQSTETPHHTLNLGVLAGLSYRGGWGLATGLEYSAARYDFQHLDQFSSIRDSLVTHVITFNSQVVDSYVDTLTTFTEVRRTVAAVNHYTSLRVPLEGSWHKAWRRWHFGFRGGMAMEFNTMRSGVTLMNEQGGTRSVDVSTTEKRTAILLSGGLAADVGYAINERLGIWASPGYASGLLSLSPTDGTPYAVPERMGIRFRLAYTLRPSR